jgi:Transposase DDE domain
VGGSRAGEIRVTRFLRNRAVTVEEMVGTAAARTGAAAVGRHVLAIQDTTVVRSEGGGGLYLHPVLAVDADDGALLGLIHGEFLSRTSGRKGLRGTLPVAEKESRRWLTGAERAAAVCAGAARLTVIADREGDIFEAFAERPAGCDLLIRAAQDRRLGAGPRPDGARLFAALDALPEGGRATLALPSRPGRAARDAVVAVRFGPLALRRPWGRRADLPPSVPVTCIDLREVAAPAGVEPLHWRLLTTHAVADTKDAFAIADLYRRRWAIEQVFRSLKSKGFDIEGLTIEAEAPLAKLVTAALIAAVHLQQLVHARDGTTEGAPGRLRPLTDAFAPEDVPLIEAFCDRLEGKTLRQKNPHPRGSLAYATWVCARLGGWTGYYGKPGPAVLLQGWLYFQAAKHGAEIATPAIV